MGTGWSSYFRLLWITTTYQTESEGGMKTRRMGGEWYKGGGLSKQKPPYAAFSSAVELPFAALLY